MMSPAEQAYLAGYMHKAAGIVSLSEDNFENEIDDLEDRMPSPGVEALKSALLSAALSGGGTALLNAGHSRTPWGTIAGASAAGAGIGGMAGYLGQRAENAQGREELDDLRAIMARK